MKSRRRHLFIADVFHQYRVFSHCVGFRNGHTGLVERLQCRKLVHQPGSMTDLYPERRFLVDCPGSAAITPLDCLRPPVLCSQKVSALPVNGIIAQVPKLAGTVNLGSNPLHTKGIVCSATVNIGLLPSFHLRHYVYNLVLLIERPQGGSQETALKARRSVRNLPNALQVRDFGHLLHLCAVHLESLSFILWCTRHAKSRFGQPKPLLIVFQFRHFLLPPDVRIRVSSTVVLPKLIPTVLFSFFLIFQSKSHP